MNLVDRLLCEVDTALRTVFAVPHAQRPLPRADDATAPPTSREESIRLMRVNHCGEVCAQALYQGQAMVARQPGTRALLESAAEEERDHLAWCATRLKQLGGETSKLTPFFYAGSFGMGVASGLLGDKWSMGFLVETERQVEAHLHDHLERMDPADAGSRRILEAMQEDEVRHGNAGLAQGARELPEPLRKAMRAFSKVMTGSTYRV